MVASDGPATPDDVSGDLTLWSFPEGRLIKRLPGRPTAISANWKYYATSHGVAELATGKPVISAGKAGTPSTPSVRMAGMWPSPEPAASTPFAFWNFLVPNR